jgi:hypothetical protein
MAHRNFSWQILVILPVNGHHDLLAGLKSTKLDAKSAPCAKPSVLISVNNFSCKWHADFSLLNREMFPILLVPSQLNVACNKPILMT